MFETLINEVGEMVFNISRIDYFSFSENSFVIGINGLEFSFANVYSNKNNDIHSENLSIIRKSIAKL